MTDPDPAAVEADDELIEDIRCGLDVDDDTARRIARAAADFRAGRDIPALRDQIRHKK